MWRVEQTFLIATSFKLKFSRRQIGWVRRGPANELVPSHIIHCNSTYISPTVRRHIIFNKEFSNFNVTKTYNIPVVKKSNCKYFRWSFWNAAELVYQKTKSRNLVARKFVREGKVTCSPGNFNRQCIGSREIFPGTYI